MTRSVTFKANYWYYEEEDGKALIHVGGRTAENKTVHVLVKHFTPFVYVELPRRIGWNKARCQAFFQYLQRSMKSEGPISFSMHQKYRLHFKKLIYTMFMSFPTEVAARKLARKCSNARGFACPGVGSFQADEFKVHEHNIDAVLKFTAVKNIKLASWVTIRETIPSDEVDLDEEERKFSTADIDMVADWMDVNSAKEPRTSTYLPPKYCSFDIECNSKNHNSKLPNPEIPENAAFQISMVFGFLGGEADTRHRVLLSLGRPRNIENCDELLVYAAEAELLLDFSRLVREHDPDIFIGYNIMKFDWTYLIKRAEILGIYLQFAQLGRIMGKRADLRTINWSSQAYGEQNFSYFECHGRTNVDVLLEVERNYRLPKYSLDAVAEKFLGKHKDDVSPRGLFMLYQLTTEILPQVYGKKITLRDLVRYKRRIQEIFPVRKCHGIVTAYRTRLLKARTRNFADICCEAMEITGKYCVQDSVLPVELVEKLNMWPGMEAMSNVTNVPVSYLHTRGQQIKVLAQIYRETIRKDIIIPYLKKTDTDEKYQGAIVIEANEGDYERVATLDFASLYPTVMITFNICYTTILEDGDPTPDSECHVLDWRDDVGCLARNTPISLSNRSEKIQDMNEYVQRVYACDDKKSSVELYDQTAHYEQGVKECVQLTFEDGTVLKCTPDHRILASSGKWIEAQNLEIGGNVQMTYRPPVYDIPSDYVFRFAGRKYQGQDMVKLMQLFGLICTDGATTKGRTLAYTGHKQDTASVVDSIYELSGELAVPVKGAYGWKIPILGTFGEAFRTTPGIVLGTKTRGRSIPDFLFDDKCPRSVIAAFLSGMFGGDGHTLTYSPNAMALSPVAFSWTEIGGISLEPIFNKIITLLRRLSFNPTISKHQSEVKLRLPIDETLDFHAKIGFAHCVHKAMRLEAGCLYLRHRNEVWQQQYRIVENVRRARDLINQAIADEPFLYNEYYGHPSSSQMNDLLRDRKDWSKPMFGKEHFPGPMEYMEKIGARELFADGDGVAKYAVRADADTLSTFSVPLLHRESCGRLPTYDLEVDDSHSFVANGVVVHNCEHDPQKRKRKKEDIMCCHHRYRFRKIKYTIDERGQVKRENEGVMPRLERNLLGARKVYKKEMFKAEATIKMHKGTATEGDLAYYKKMGWTIIAEGSLGENEAMMMEVTHSVLNANQLAVKISANSVGPNTPIPCLVTGNSFGIVEYRTIEELFDENNYTIDDDGNEVCVPPKGVKVWCDGGWSDMKYVFRHALSKDDGLHRVLTHTGCVDVTSDHSLLTPDGAEVTTNDLDVGDDLLHIGVPLPDDTPRIPRYTYLYDEDIAQHELESREERLAFLYGLLLAEREKRIPSYIFSALYNVRLAFFIGYRYGDVGDRDTSSSVVVTNKSQIGTAELYHLARSLGYKVSISYSEEVFHLELTTKFREEHSAIKSISSVPRSLEKKKQYDPGSHWTRCKLRTYRSYVYDIETTTHHFAAGVGDLIVHNSAYGAMGVKNGMIPLIPGAASVTAMGRRLIMMAIDKIKKEYPTMKLVYGDSVTGDTPILCRIGGSICYRTIEELYSTSTSAPNDSFDEKDRVKPSTTEVWTEQGFTAINNVIRHKTSKKLYRVLTHTGVVDVTEDHSLLNENAEKIKPKDVSVGQILLHSDLPELEGADNELPLAYAMGLFYGDGSCGRYDCPSGVKSSWAINNTNMNFLVKAKRCLERHYPSTFATFKILNTMKSSAVYKLVACGHVSQIVEEWREMFYDSRKYKKVPDSVFVSTLEARQEFFDGYYAADGDKDAKGYLRFDNKGKIGAAGLYLLASSLGYPVSINTRSDKSDIYRMTLTRNGKKQRLHPGKIKKITTLPSPAAGEYVYDLETANHHFSAGIGRMIVHNTDSCMIHFTGASLAEAFDLAEESSGVATHYLKCYITGVQEDFTVGEDEVPITKMVSSDTRFVDLTYEEQCHVLDYESCPIDLEFENMYGRFLLLTKKRYVAHSVNREGEIIGTTKKGVVLTRRDNSRYLRDTYGDMANGILDKIPEQDVMYGLYNHIQMLFTRQIPTTHLIIYVGIKSLVHYAKSRKIKKGRQIVDMFPIDVNGDAIDDVVGPLDPRLIYPNYPQVLLALKMARRGEEIPPNTRLEFLYIRVPNAEHQGEKAEDYTYYRENKDVEALVPDYLHYLEKQLTNPVTELLTVKFSKGIVPYVKVEDRFRKCLSELNELHRFRVANTTVYNKPRPDPIARGLADGYVVGWDLLRECGYEPRPAENLAPDRTFETYTYKKYMAQATYVLDQMKYETGPLSMSRESYPDFYTLCAWWKSVDVIDTFYKNFGLTRRRWKKPTYVGDKLRDNTSIVMMTDAYVEKGVKKGDTGRILERFEIGPKGDFRYTYDIIFDEASELIVKEIPREAFTTYIMKDGAVMKDILGYRIHYSQVVAQLDDFNARLVFCE